MPEIVLPPYAELADAVPPYSSWSIAGIDPRLGMLSLLDGECATAAAALVRRGARFRLDAELDLFDPPLYGRAGIEHAVVDLDNVFDEVVSGWNTQSSSQWDGFLHIRHPVEGYYRGLEAAEHGIDHWARAGITGRGVLVDVARHRAAQGRPLVMDESDPIEIEDVVDALAATGTEVRRGDILIVRTGWLEWYRSLDTAGRIEAATLRASPGLRSSTEVLEFLWNLQISAVAADNPALEVWPPGVLVDRAVRAAARTDRGRLTEVFMHYALLPLLGLPIGELWDLAALADDCAADGVYEFLLTSAPIMLSRGVASPPNAIAVK